MEKNFSSDKERKTKEFSTVETKKEKFLKVCLDWLVFIILLSAVFLITYSYLKEKVGESNTMLFGFIQGIVLMVIVKLFNNFVLFPFLFRHRKNDFFDYNED